jgi:starch synthase
MKILSVASEIYPLVKTGGLADVAGALPLALGPLGVSVTTLIPGYPAVMAEIGKARKVHGYADLFGAPARILRTTFAELDLLILDAPALFDRDGGPYGDSAGTNWPDNWKRFAALSRVAADIAQGVVKGFAPDVLHAHDWQAAMAIPYLHYGAGKTIPSVLTIHNLAFQGQFDAALFPELSLPAAAFAIDGVEYYGGVGFLKGGIQMASAITTVSPRYADEIATADFGMGLEGLIRSRAGVLHGILNGIDTDVWNPATDPHIAATYTARSLPRRAANRHTLETRFGIDPDDAPLFAVISRLTEQKGMDLLADALDDLVGMGAKLIVLGSGDGGLETAFLNGASRHAGRIGVFTGYDENLSHLAQAGADAVLIPSRFEPCGLTQLYALRYGCVPIVGRTGGLSDTVIDANVAALAAGVATGIAFAPVDGHGLRQALRHACDLFADRAAWVTMQKRGMMADFSWGKSAALYAALYRSLLEPGR